MRPDPELRIVLVGSVGSSEQTLRKLIEHDLQVVGVFGYQSDRVERVSGYVDLERLATEAGIPFSGFRNINEQGDAIKKLTPDLLFVVGLSQLVSDDIILTPTHGCVGFHPTYLPLGRGRAPLAWMILDGIPGAASFFKIADGVDDGPIYVQVPYTISEQDDAADVSNSLMTAIDLALDDWLPRLKAGDLSCMAQVEGQATVYGKRSPEDGLIRWQDSAESVQKLIQASAAPHPGAYTFVGNVKMTIWKSERCPDARIRGVCGRILGVEEGAYPVVQTGSGVIRLLSWDLPGKFALRVGDQLGYMSQNEIYRLRQELAELRGWVQELRSAKTPSRS